MATKTLGQMRKDLSYDVAADIRTIANFFMAMATANPELLKAQFSARMQADRPDMMVQFYIEMAEALARDFDTRG